MRISDWSSDVCSSDLLMHVSLSATIAPLDSPQCSADVLPRLHLGAVRADIDPALDPATVQPLLAGFDHAMRQAFSADATDALAGPVAPPMAISHRSSDLYAALAYRSEEHTSELQSLMRISYAV